LDLPCARLVRELDDVVVKRGKRDLIVSSEHTEEVYGDRLMVRRTRVDALKYRSSRARKS